VFVIGKDKSSPVISLPKNQGVKDTIVADREKKLQRAAGAKTTAQKKKSKKASKRSE